MSTPQEPITTSDQTHTALRGWFTIPSGRPFLEDLAKGLRDHLGAELSSANVLMPTRRGTRMLARAFGKLTHDGALLLPQLRAIGDLNEGEPPFDLEALGLDLPPAMSHIKRRFELTKLVYEHYRPKAASTMPLKTALGFADALAGFFDSLALEEIEAKARLERLMSGEGEDSFVLGAWAEHWQVSAAFLNIAVKAWPKRLETLGLMDPSQRQAMLIRRLVNQWAETPPQSPTLVAGSTGSAPSMADLMQVVAAAPSGMVILPGLDLSLAEEAWAMIEESHPQNTLRRLLERHSLKREDIRIWPQSHRADRRATARRRLLNEALRPAEATRDWRKEINTLRAVATDYDPIALGLEGLSKLEARDDEQAAALISLLMVEALQTPNKSVALITPDQTLSRRVSAHLSRFGLEADSSAGTPLSFSLVGRFILEALKLWQTPYEAVSLLSLMRHPFFECEDTALIDRFETVLRGPAPRHGLDLETALAADSALMNLWQKIREPEATDCVGSALSTWVCAFVTRCESLSRDNGQILWSGAAGAQAANLFSELIREGEDISLDEVATFCDLITDMIRQATVRTGGNTHPRLMILGAIEARLVDADRVILAGLEEGVWPQSPVLDPFLSRPMRLKLGLPSPERRIGLSAHDFVQAACTPETFFIVRRRKDGNPLVPSRWIWRLETLARGDNNQSVAGNQQLIHWADEINTALKNVPPHLMAATRPEPKPEVELRPMQLSVTEVETLVRDPYAIYAKKILNLKPLDRPNEPFESMARGTLIHKALERYETQTRHPLGAEGVRCMGTLLNEEYGHSKLSAADLALRRPLVASMAENIIAWEEERRQSAARIFSEQKGSLPFAHPRGQFTLVARADRIEIKDDEIDIIDFKTGTVPSLKQVLAGYSPQLTLTAAIVKGGGFDHLGFINKPIGALIYVKIASDGIKLTTLSPKDTPNAVRADEALGRLQKLLGRFESKDYPYRSWIAPQYRGEYGGNYDHLARLYEWQVLGDDDASGAEPDA